MTIGLFSLVASLTSVIERALSYNLSCNIYTKKGAKISFTGAASGRMVYSGTATRGRFAMLEMSVLQRKGSRCDFRGSIKQFTSSSSRRSPTLLTQKT